MSRNRTRILIVDDHPVVRQGLAQLIGNEDGLEVCGQASGIRDGLQTVKTSDPDLLIVDLTLADGSGLALIGQVRDCNPDLPILVLSMHDEALYAKRCLKAGARGYIMKQDPPERVIDAIRTVLAGNVYAGPSIRNTLVEDSRFRTGVPSGRRVECLSNRELEVFELIGGGLSNRDIATRLFVSIKTVESHIEHIKKKLGVPTMRELLVEATGWIQARGSR